MLDRIRIVLVDTSHPGNIGATARAMRNMGLSDLALVRPKEFPSAEATSRAAGASEILAHARVCDTLTEALAGAEYVFGASARERALSLPMLTPRDCAEKLFQLALPKMALVFGNERSGLSNEDLACCHQQVVIPTVPDFSSLNLAAAVQVLVYELFVCSLAGEQASTKKRKQLASAEQLAGLYQHIADAMNSLGILDPNHPKLLMRRLKRIFNRAELDRVELNILRGICSAVEKSAKK